MQPGGHFDAVYIHAEHQGKGIASALLACVEEEAHALKLDHIFTEASITVLPFFQRRGFTLIEAQDVFYQSMRFRNYRMKKDLEQTETLGVTD